MTEITAVGPKTFRYEGNNNGDGDDDGNNNVKGAKMCHKKKT